MTKYYQYRENKLFISQKKIVDRVDIKKPLIFDVGANTGQSIAKYRSLFPKCTIHAFEPNPRSFRKLHEKYKNNCDIKLNCVGLSNYSGKFIFYDTKVSKAASLLKPTKRLMNLSKKHKYDYKKIEIECDTLDSYSKISKIKHIDILKIDVQGAEALILRGANELLSKHMIAIIYIEITNAETYEKQSNLIDILSPLEKNGYKLWDFSPFLYTTPGRLWAANAIFLSPDIILRLENII